MGTGKTGKYLIYAMGEIVLVVIGILIAVQINNWNKEIRNSTLEKLTLQNLRTDLVLQSEIIESQLGKEQIYDEYVDSCLLMINSTLEIKNLSNFLDSLTARLTFIENRVTFENLRLDGNETLITNSELQVEIVKYYQLLDYTSSVINNNNLYRVNSQFGNFVVNNELGFRLTKEGKIDHNYTLSPEQRYTLKKQLDGRRYSANNNAKKCAILLKGTKILIDLIDQELNEK